MWGRDSEEVWDRHAHTAIFKMDNPQGPAVDQGTLLNVFAHFYIIPFLICTLTRFLQYVSGL